MAKQPVDEVDELEAKQQRKAAKRAAKEAAATAEGEEEEIDEAEVKRQRKAAKKAAKEAAAVTLAAEEEEEEEVDEAEAKRQRKAARKAAKEAAAAVVAEDEAALAKKSTTVADDTQVAVPVGGKEFKVFIKGLPYSVDESSLRADFAECGEITNLQLPMEDGKPKGFAFVYFSTQDGLDAALKYDNSEYNGRWISVAQANPSGTGKDSKGKDGKGKGKGKASDWNCPECGDLVFGRNNNCRACGCERPGGPVATAGEHDHENTVFIRGLPWAQTEEELRKHFGDCGEIESIRMPINGEGRPSGIAFIKFTAPEGVTKALKFDESDYGGRWLNVVKSGENTGKGKDKGKDKGKGKDGKGKDGKGKGKGKGKSKAPSESFAKSQGVIVTGMAKPQTFDDSDDE